MPGRVSLTRVVSSHSESICSNVRPVVSLHSSSFIPSIPSILSVFDLHTKSEKDILPVLEVLPRSFRREGLKMKLV